MLDIREIRVAAQRALAREIKHLRTQRGKHTPLGRERRRGRVEPVEKLDRRVSRPGVIARRFRMARADPNQPAVAVVALERGRLGGDQGGIATQILVMPVAATSVSVASSSGRSSSASGEPPNQKAP